MQLIDPRMGGGGGGARGSLTCGAASPGCSLRRLLPPPPPPRAVAPLKEEAALLFYGELFIVAPETKELFKGGNMRNQAIRLFKMLDISVSGLSGDLPQLVSVLKDLGRRHVSYGVVDAHYDAVGEALLATLKKALAPSGAWTPEVVAAWSTVYGVIASTMKAGAKTDPDYAASEAAHAAGKAAGRGGAASSAAEGVAWVNVASAVAAVVALAGIAYVARGRLVR